MSAFKSGDRVAWSHSVATMFPAGAAVLESAVLASDPNAEFGKVRKVANDEGTYFDVELKNGVKTLTVDELVKVSE